MILFSRFSSFYEGKRIRDILKLNEQLFLEGGGGIRIFFFFFTNLISILGWGKVVRLECWVNCEEL